MQSICRSFEYVKQTPNIDIPSHTVTMTLLAAKPFYTIRTRTNKFRNSFILYSLDMFT